jgi:hypothetical protein
MGILEKKKLEQPTTIWKNDLQNLKPVNYHVQLFAEIQVQLGCLLPVVSMNPNKHFEYLRQLNSFLCPINFTSSGIEGILYYLNLVVHCVTKLTSLCAEITHHIF